MGQRFIIDTCVIIKYLNNEFSNEWLNFLDNLMDATPYISFITEIELLAWKSGSNAEMARRRIVVNGVRKVYINQPIINRTIAIRKEANIKIPDSIIAATALNNGLTLISTNHNDFDKTVKLGLPYINPEIDTISDIAPIN